MAVRKIKNEDENYKEISLKDYQNEIEKEKKEEKKRIANEKRKQTKLTNEIKNYLINKGVYESTDDILIKELVFMIKLADETKNDIINRGTIINVRAHTPDKQPYWQPNPSISNYQTSVKSIMSLSAKLGISVQDREKLKLHTTEKDELDDLLSS